MQIRVEGPMRQHHDDGRPVRWLAIMLLACQVSGTCECATCQRVCGITHVSWTSLLTTLNPRLICCTAQFLAMAQGCTMCLSHIGAPVSATC